MVGWVEQRSILRNAIAALPPASDLAVEIGRAFVEIEGPDTPRPFDGAAGLEDVPPTSRCPCAEYDLAFGVDGSISSVVHRPTGRVIANSAHPLLRPWYMGMGRDYFKAFVHEYVAGISSITPTLAAENLFKPNLQLPPMSANATLLRLRRTSTSVSPGHSVTPAASTIDTASTSSSDTILLDLSFPADVHGARGAPSSLQALLECSAPPSGSSAGTNIRYTLRWFNKTATHAPETIWLSSLPLPLAPQPRSAASPPTGIVSLDKLGSAIDPMDTDLGCDGKHR